MITAWASRRGEVARDLDSVEFFSGMHAITSAVLAHGKRATCLDRAYTEDDDMCSDRGYERSVGLVMRIKPQGNLWQAPCM